MSRLEEIKERVEKATGGEWHYDYEYYVCAMTEESNKAIVHVIDEGSVGNDNNGVFIAHARSDIPWLISELEKARAALTPAKIYTEAFLLHCSTSPMAQAAREYLALLHETTKPEVSDER